MTGSGAFCTTTACNLPQRHQLQPASRRPYQQSATQTDQSCIQIGAGIGINHSGYLFPYNDWEHTSIASTGLP